MTDVRRILSENRRVVSILTVALAANAALYALIVYPLSRRVELGEQSAGAATRELVAARKSFDAARGTVSGKKQADEELQKFYREVLPADFSGARRMLYPVDQMARKSNLRTVNAGLSSEQDRATHLRKLTLTMRLEGEYTGVRRFIHALETAPEFLVLEGVTVTQEGEGSDRTLAVTAKVATYYRGPANGN
jgi:Tfp pilus assembly protein PilO